MAGSTAEAHGAVSFYSRD